MCNDRPFIQSLTTTTVAYLWMNNAIVLTQSDKVMNILFVCFSRHSHVFYANPEVILK